MTATRMALPGALLLALGLQLAACQRAPDALVGDWAVDAEGLAELPEIRALPAPQQRQAVALARKMMGDASLRLGSDGRYRRTLAGRQDTGRWRSQPASGQQFTLELTPDSGAAERWTLHLRSPGRATLTDATGRALVLRRRP